MRRVLSRTTPVAGGLAAALVASSLALAAPAQTSAALAPTFYRIGYGDQSNTYLVDPDGANNVKVASAFAGDFDWTPNGEKFVYRSGQSGQLYFRNQDGAEFPVGSVRGQSPELSPDGTKIAYYRNVGGVDVVEVVTVSGDPVATIGPGRQPTWSPDGTKIAFAKRGERTVGCGDPHPTQPDTIDLGGDGLAVAPASGGATSWLVEPGSQLGGGAPNGATYFVGGNDPDWSPDGTSIVVHGQAYVVTYNASSGRCSSSVDGGFDVFTVASSGGEPTNLTAGAEWIGGTAATEPDDLNASYSPDSAQIAFASNRNAFRDGGIHSLWLMDAGGGDPTLVRAVDRVDETDWMTALPVGEVVRINAPDPCATEKGPTPGTFTIERTGVTNGDLPVTIRLAASSTATQGADFRAIPTTVTIPNGSSLVNLVVLPIDDAVPEPHESITVELVSAQGMIIGTPARATISIADDDGGPPGPCTPAAEPPPPTPPVTTPTGPSPQCVAATTAVAKAATAVQKAKAKLKKAEGAGPDKVAALKKKLKAAKKKSKQAQTAAAAACG